MIGDIYKLYSSALIHACKQFNPQTNFKVSSKHQWNSADYACSSAGQYTGIFIYLRYSRETGFNCTTTVKYQYFREMLNPRIWNKQLSLITIIALQEGVLQ